MITTAWEQIDAATLQALCDAGETESATLDFKRLAPKYQASDADRDSYKDEFAKDVCALANANGGDLVYGIAEANGAASRIVPIEDEEFDACRRRLLQVLDNHVEPRVSRIQFKEVPIGAGGYVLVVRVPGSFDGPHRANVRGRDGIPPHSRFYKRNQSLTHDMDYGQLRDAFGRTATLVEKARALRAERLALMVREGQLVAPMSPGPKICIHLVPLSGLTNGTPLGVAATYERSDIGFAFAGGIEPLRSTNLDGLLFVGPPQRNSSHPDVMIRLFRDGAMEYLFRGFRDPDPASKLGPYIPAVPVTEEIRRICKQLLDHARALGMEGPAIIGLACIQCQQHRFEIETRGRVYGNGLADREHLVLPDFWVSDMAVQFDNDTIVRPMLDAFWQCFHEVRCHHYDLAGSWLEMR